MEDRGKAQLARRLSWLAYGGAAWGAAIFLQLIHLQVIRHHEYTRLARKQQLRLVEIPAPRGAIYDRNGHPLAMSVNVDSVYVNPLRLADIAVAADVVSPVLDLDRAQLYQRLKFAVENEQGFLWVKRRISLTESDRLRSLKLDWIEFQSESVRLYPKRASAAHALGSVDHEEKGNAGIELGLDKDLRGRPGMARMLTDVRKRGIEALYTTEPRAGTNLTLSIDERIQFVAERELKAAVEGNHCKTGSVIVINPQNGELLAMASYPTYDPNQRPGPGEDLSARLNNAIASPFEPGSVFKVFTLATALDTTSMRPETVMPCGVLTLAGKVVHEAKHAFGPMSMALILAKSSNVGAAQIGMRVGAEKLSEYVRRFGFGRLPGLRLPSESPGMLRKVENWDPASPGYISFGHEISTTTMQLAQACSVIANGGLRVRPKLILKKQRPGEHEEKEPTEPPVRVLKADTAITMRTMMEGVVLHGTGAAARLEGYSSGGKTGSAQIFDFESKHYTHFYNSSFMGFAPVTNPAVVVVVTLNGARQYGGAVAAPVFRTVTSEALRVLEVPKDLPEQTAEPERPIDETLIADASSPPERPPLDEDTPPAPLEGPAPNRAEVFGPKVPDFQGKTMRAVLEEATARGLPVLLAGKGVARSQVPAAGAILPRGERVRVQFAR